MVKAFVLTLVKHAYAKGLVLSVAVKTDLGRIVFSLP